MRIRTKKITETHLQCAIHFNVIWLDTINITNIIVLTAIVIVFYVQTKTSSEKTTPSWVYLGLQICGWNCCTGRRWSRTLVCGVCIFYMRLQ